jgi:transposase
MEKITTIGVDLAKNTFHIHAADRKGKKIHSKKITRRKLLSYAEHLSPCTIGIEACGGAHFWAREFAKFGHSVKIMAPQYVKPYVKTNKNDRADAEAICEAVTRPNMRFVPMKSTNAQDMQSIHRVRERLIKARTALINEIRGLIGEYGIIFPKGRISIMEKIHSLVEEADNGLTIPMRELLLGLYDEYKFLKEKIEILEEKLKVFSKENDVCKRIMKVPGIGMITATALYSTIGEGADAFKNGRQFAAWLGLVPRQHSTGGKERLLGISKRGDSYLRKQLVHGARALTIHCSTKTKNNYLWLRKIKEKRGFNKASVAMANKTARIIWAMVAKNEEYKEVI